MSNSRLAGHRPRLNDMLGVEKFGKYVPLKGEKEPSVLVARVSDLKSKVHAQVKDGCQEEEKTLGSRCLTSFIGGSKNAHP